MTTTSTSHISLLVSICQLFCFEMAICDDANKMYLLLEWWQQQGRSGIRTIGWVSMKQRMNISCNHTCLQNLASHPTLHLSDFQKSATTEPTYLNYKFIFLNFDQVIWERLKPNVCCCISHFVMWPRGIFGWHHGYAKNWQMDAAHCMLDVHYLYQEFVFKMT